MYLGIESVHLFGAMMARVGRLWTFLHPPGYNPQLWMNLAS
jgi:hypothetical protein